MGSIAYLNEDNDNYNDDNDVDTNSNDVDIDPGVVANVGGQYGILDWRGFHPSPDSTLKEEIRRDPLAAIRNRLSRAKKLKNNGNVKAARKLKKEADYIKNTINHKESFQPREAKPRFSS